MMSKYVGCVSSVLHPPFPPLCPLVPIFFCLSLFDAPEIAEHADASALSLSVSIPRLFWKSSFAAPSAGCRSVTHLLSRPPFFAIARRTSYV